METVAVLELPGVQRSHGAIWQWMHRLADSEPDPPTAQPSRVAVDETAVKIGIEWYWLYAAVDLNPLYLDRISQQLYVAEFGYISDAIDLQYMEEPDAAVTADSYDDALQRYAATLTELDSFQNLHQLTGEFQTPEIVVEGGVKPDRIVEWRLLKAIRDEQSPSE